MGILDYSGPMSVAMGFIWKSAAVPNALSARAASKRQILANESVFELTVTGIAGHQRTALVHKATPQHRYYDPALNMYTTRPVRGSELERLLDPRAPARFTVDLTFTYMRFFDVMLEQMTRTDGELRNLARPNDSSAILETFDHEVRDGRVHITFEPATHSAQGVPCTLVDIDIKARPSPRAPAVKLLFEIGFDAPDVMRRLIAMDLTGLARFGNSEARLPTQAEVWKDNVLVYLAKQTDMSRAERFRSAIAARHIDKPVKELADDVRKDIDAHVITANHWPEPRETLHAERHQALISDLLGTLHQSAWLASPLCMTRDLARIYGLGLDEKAALTLQYGTGSCGEHSRTSFSILRTIMGTPGSRLESIVLCGNANLDHGFVLCNLQVTHVLHTTATNPANTRVSIGQELKVFNLRDALARNGEHAVYVVDPYLDTSMMRPTADGLLLSLNSKKKIKRGKDTDFLMYSMQHPEPPELTIEDLRHRSLEERMRLVKNI